MVAQLEDFRSAMDEDDLRQFSSDYFIPLDVHPEVPDVNACIADFPAGKIGLYTRFFEYASYRVPISMFLSNVLNFYNLHISQLHCIGAAKISNVAPYHRPFPCVLPHNVVAWVGIFCEAGSAPSVLYR